MLGAGPPPLVVAVEDPCGAWDAVEETIASRSPLRSVRVAPRVGAPIDVDVPVAFIRSTHPSLAALAARAASPAAWFRAPVAVLAVVAGDDPDAWRSGAARAALAALAARDADPVRGPGGWAVLYVPSAGASVAGTAAAKGAAKTFAAVRAEFSTRRADRCVRADAAGALPALDRLLAAAVSAAVDARAGAYQEAARALAAARADPGWRLAPLALVKDAAAALAEASGRRDDALREYGELEALHAAGGGGGGAGAAAAPAPPAPGDDAAALTSAPWRRVRALAAAPPPGPPDLAFRQAVFAQQVRLLLAGGGRGDAAESGARFIGAIAPLLAARAAAGVVPPLFPEAWTFSACVAVAQAAAPPARRPSSPAGDDDDACALALSWPPPDRLPPPHPAPGDRALAARLGDLYVAARDELARLIAGVGLKRAAAAAADARLAPGAAPAPLAGAAPSPTRGRGPAAVAVPPAAAPSDGHLVAGRPRGASPRAVPALARRATSAAVEGDDADAAAFAASSSPIVSLTSLPDRGGDRGGGERGGDDDAAAGQPPSAVGTPRRGGDGPGAPTTADSVSSELADAGPAGDGGSGVADGGGSSAAGSVRLPAPPLSLDWGGDLADVEAALAGEEAAGGEAAAPAPPAASRPRAPHLPAWLTEPRLAAALASDDAALDLWLALTGAAVAGYAHGGRPRRAAALAAGAARALTARGDPGRAAAALAAHAASAAAEGWTRLEGDLLAELADAQAAAAGGGAAPPPPSTPLALLALPPASVPPAARARAAAALAAAAAAGGGSPLAGRPPSPDLTLPDGSLAAGAALTCRGVGGARVAGRLLRACEGEEEGEGEGAAPPVPLRRVAVGDDARLALVLASALPAPLTDVKADVVLALLQPVERAEEDDGEAARPREWRETETLTVAATLPAATVAPGDNRLAAVLCPLAPGLYVLKSVRVAWGALTLTADAVGPPTALARAGAPRPRLSVVADDPAPPLLAGVGQWVGLTVDAGADDDGGGGATAVSVAPSRRAAAAAADAPRRVGAAIAPDAVAVALSRDGAPLVPLALAAAPGGGLRAAALPGGARARLFLWTTPDAPPPPPPRRLRRDHEGDAGPPPPPAGLDIDVCVERGGRAAAARVCRAVAPPLTLTPRLHASGPHTLLELEIASAAPWPVRVERATVDGGGSGWAAAAAAAGPSLGAALPLTLPPRGVARLVGGLAASGGDDDGSACGVEVAWRRAEDDGGDGSGGGDVPPPPAGAPLPAGTARAEFTLPPPPSSGTGVPSSTVPAAAAASAPPVAVRLLGPLAARAGAAVTLCWRLQRSPDAPPPPDAPTSLGFEVRPPPGGGWAPGGAHGGTVALAAARGAAAIVEVSLTPAPGAHGPVRAPALTLTGADAREVGGAAFVVVS